MIDLANCIHCGLCLEACPTYRVLGDEAESPRGRLRLMGELQRGAALDYAALDHCLGCRGCESVCPSGVPYGAHLEHARAQRPPSALQRFLVDRVLSDRRVLRLSLPFARIAASLGLGAALPVRARAAHARLPKRREGTVALMPGCAQAVLQPQVLSALCALLEALGETPYLATETGCCGALSAHQGSPSLGAARREAFERSRPTVPLLVASAGCSAHLAGVDGVHDALVWLAERVERLHFEAAAERVAYHPPCHHSHAQGLRGAAERLLDRVPRLERVAPADPERCCGSAGSYSLFHPELANAVRAEKWEDLRAVAPQRVLSANPGCEFHLAAGRGAEDPPVENLYVYLAGRLGSSPAAC